MLKGFITILAIGMTVLAIGAILAMASPVTFGELISKLPPSIQTNIASDWYINYQTGFYGYWAIIATAWGLWWLRARIKSSYKNYGTNRHSTRNAILVIFCLVIASMTTAAFKGISPFGNWKASIENFINNDNGIASVSNLQVPYISWGYTIQADLTPTDKAVPNTTYLVQLWEKNTIRDTETIRWSLPEINVKTTKSIYFPCSYQEYQAYVGQNIKGIFSVKIIQ